MANTLFKDYVASLPAASTPLSGSETIPILQAGAMVQADYSVVIPSPPQLIDATSGDINKDIKDLVDVIIIKSDSTANKVNIIDSSGNTVLGGIGYSLTVQREAVRLVLIGNDWYKVP